MSRFALAYVSSLCLILANLRNIASAMLTNARWSWRRNSDVKEVEGPGSSVAHYPRYLDMNSSDSCAVVPRDRESARWAVLSILEIDV